MTESFTGLVDQYGKPLTPPKKARDPREVRAAFLKARYDAARTTDQNYRHWQNADGLSARLANSPDVRKVLRERSRYECENNGYAKGLCESIAHDTIGTGPRIQLTIPGASPEQERIAEMLFNSWSEDDTVDLAEKLRIADESGVRDGEAFLMMFTNRGVEHPIKLDLKVIETEVCHTPGLYWADPRRVDGIDFDNYGNPEQYWMLREHPGDGFFQVTGLLADPVAAKWVCHWFRTSRAGQARGVPEITPGIPLFAQLRRYSLATLMAAEWAASVTGVLYTDMPVPDGTEEEDIKTYDNVPGVPGKLLTLPYQWKAEQIDPKHPAAEFGPFKGEQLDEIGRAVHAPSNVVRGNSREYNFSSGRLDYTIYHKSLGIKRRRWDKKALKRVAREFYAECRIAGLLPPGLPDFGSWQVAWQWDGFESIDPMNDANARKTDLSTGMATYADLLAQQGINWQDHFQQMSREVALAKSLNIPLSYGLGLGGGTNPAQQGDGKPAATTPPGVPTTPEQAAAQWRAFRVAQSEEHDYHERNGHASRN